MQNGTIHDSRRQLSEGWNKKAWKKLDEDTERRLVPLQSFSKDVYTSTKSEGVRIDQEMKMRKFFEKTVVFTATPRGNNEYYAQLFAGAKKFFIQRHF